MSASDSAAGRVGRWLGRGWRELVRQEMRLAHRLIRHGMPQIAVVSVLWVLKLALFGILLYAFFWLGVLLLLATIAALIARRVDVNCDSREWAIGEQAEHKQSVFYDPINYSDTPDPRFDDE